MTPFAFVLSLPIRLYRLVFSPWVGHHCRYDPTCSNYALEALRAYGGWRGAFLSIRRLLRCHPFARTDNVFDDVPMPPPRTEHKPPAKDFSEQQSM